MSEHFETMDNVEWLRDAAKYRAAGTDVRMRACADELAELRKENERLNEVMEYLQTRIFERKWDGTIGRPETWNMAGPFRHELVKWRGPSLVDAIDSAKASASKEPK